MAAKAKKNALPKQQKGQKRQAQGNLLTPQILNNTKKTARKALPMQAQERKNLKRKNVICFEKTQYPAKGLTKLIGTSKARISEDDALPLSSKRLEKKLEGRITLVPAR